ncbi:MAG: ornithine cyclodeaminase family protein [Candidatus Dormibacteria bacterium]
MLLLRGEQLDRLFEPEGLLAAVGRGLIAYSRGRASAPPRVAARSEQGLLAAMPAHLPGVGLVCKLVGVFPGNPERGLPSHLGLAALFDEATGEPLALLDAAHLTAWRTAAVSCLALRTLGPTSARPTLVIGTGVEGEAHLRLLRQLDPAAPLSIWGRRRERAADLAASCAARSSAVLEEEVREADVVLCCTDSREPVLRAEWLSSVRYVGSVGSGAELPAAALEGSRVVVEWRGAAQQPPPAGAMELQGMDPAAMDELGEILAGDRPGQRAGERLTCFKSTGLGVEDAAAAGYLLGRARQLGMGTEVAL